jgi:beta-galactosidase
MWSGQLVPLESLAGPGCGQALDASSNGARGRCRQLLPLAGRHRGPRIDALGISDAPVTTRVALLHDYESLWAYDVQKHAADSSYWSQTMLFYMALRGLGLDVDIRHPSSDLSQYGAVVAPALHILSTDTAANLEKYVLGGGQLLLGPRSGFRMPSGAVWKSRAPGPLAALAGVKVQNFDSLRPGLTSRVEAFDSSYNTRTWNESLELIGDDVQVLGTYASDPMYGLAAVTHRRVSSNNQTGGTTYVGAWDEGLITNTLMHVLGLAGIKYTILEPGLRLSRRGGFVYAQNWSRGGMPAPAPEGATFVIGDALLEPAGVAVWQDEQP